MRNILLNSTGAFKLPKQESENINDQAEFCLHMWASPTTFLINGEIN